MRSTLLSITLLGMAILSLSANTAAQHRLGKICGDPHAPCGGREQFQPWELTFAFPRNAVVYESEYFYSIILKSAKLKGQNDCEKSFVFGFSRFQPSTTNTLPSRTRSESAERNAP